MSIFEFLAMSAMTIVAIGFAVRIVLYKKTGNQAYKHDIGVWWRAEK